MSFSRRILLLGVLASAATFGPNLKPLASFLMTPDDIKKKLRPTGTGRRGVSLATATSDDWALQTGSFFTVDTGDILELVDVQRFPQYPGRPNHLRPVAFVNTFEVKRGSPLTESRIYRLNHSEGGEFELLLTHASPDKPMRMLAVMN